MDIDRVIENEICMLQDASSPHIKMLDDDVRLIVFYRAGVSKTLVLSCLESVQDEQSVRNLVKSRVKAMTLDA